jgi:hypothetical protein
MDIKFFFGMSALSTSRRCKYLRAEWRRLRKLFLFGALVALHLYGTIEEQCHAPDLVFLAKGWCRMMRRGCIAIIVAALALVAETALGQASFGPIQPFAGAPSPVYVAAPYAAPTALAPIGGVGVPPSLPAPPVTLPPSFSTTPAPVVVPSPHCTSYGCAGSSHCPSAVLPGHEAYRPNPAPFAWPNQSWSQGPYGVPPMSYYGAPTNLNPAFAKP